MSSKESKGNIKAYTWFYDEHVIYAQVMVSLSLLWYYKLYYCHNYYYEIALEYAVFRLLILTSCIKYMNKINSASNYMFSNYKTKQVV